MDLTALERKYDNFYAPSFTIKVDGADILTQGAEVIDVSVDNVIDGADTFSFSVNNPYDPARSEFTWLDGGLFEVGKKVEITMGYGAKKELMFLGLITSLKMSFPAGGASKLDITGYDLSHKMMKGKHSFSWQEKKDSDVVEEMAKKYGLKTTDVKQTRKVHPVIKQDKESDYDFVKRLAERNAFEFFVFADVMVFRLPEMKNSAGLHLEWGKTLFSFSPEINIANQLTGVKVLGWDPSSKKEIVGEASPGQEVFRGKGATSASELAAKVYQGPVVEEVRCPTYNQAQADSLARSILTKRSEGLLKGSGESIGLPLLKPGITINLTGLGKKFSRLYYVEKTTHRMSTSGYTTSFNVRDNTL